MRLCVRYSSRTRRKKKKTNYHAPREKRELCFGVSHPRKVVKRSVNLRFDSVEVEQIEKAARESGRSVAGFVRYAALQMLGEINKVGS